MKCLISITVNSSNQFFALKKNRNCYGKVLKDVLDGWVKIFVIYLNVYFWERDYITNDFINNLKLTYKFISFKPKKIFLKRERRKIYFLGSHYQKYYSAWETRFHIGEWMSTVLWRAKPGVSPVSVTASVTTFPTASPSQMSHEVQAWLSQQTCRDCLGRCCGLAEPTPPARPVLFPLATRTCGHRGHLALTPRPRWTARSRGARCVHRVPAPHVAVAASCWRGGEFSSAWAGRVAVFS